MDSQLLVSNVLKHISLNSEEKELFISLLKLKSLKAGEFLVREGDICKHESFVTRGCLKSYYEDDDGVEHILDFLIEEWWADDLYSFFTQTPSKSNVKAIEDSEVLQISKTDLEKLYQQVPKFERFFRLLFQNAYITQRDQINQILSAPAEERYIQFLKRKPYALKRFPQKDIASYLGVTPQFFSTLKKKHGS
ncbi:cAMP-binding protein [Cytophagales bacterium WSM2-2]|nr:cAMP-binding protein [Cytophagales bacterium WSM2-2]